MSDVTDTDRDKAASAIWGEHGLQEFGDALRAVDALVSIGWRPGGAPDPAWLAKHDVAVIGDAGAEIERLTGIIRAARSYTQSRQWWGERHPDEGPLPERNLLALHHLLDEVDDEHLKEVSRSYARHQRESSSTGETNA